jgi:hypothetical protein
LAFSVEAVMRSYLASLFLAALALMGCTSEPPKIEPDWAATALIPKDVAIRILKSFDPTWSQDDQRWKGCGHHDLAAVLFEQRRYLQISDGKIIVFGGNAVNRQFCGFVFFTKTEQDRIDVVNALNAIGEKTFVFDRRNR